MDFNERKNQEVMNLLFSYSVSEDYAAVNLGYKFLGAGFDKEGNEVHVFKLSDIQ